MQSYELSKKVKKLQNKLYANENDLNKCYGLIEHLTARIKELERSISHRMVPIPRDPVLSSMPKFGGPIFPSIMRGNRLRDFIRPRRYQKRCFIGSDSESNYE